MKFQIQDKTQWYLNVSVSSEELPTKLAIYADDTLLGIEQLKISAHPQMWAAIPLTVEDADEIRVELLEDAFLSPEELSACILLEEAPHDQAELYREEQRPLFHFTPPRGFLNDPNGLYYDAKEQVYHMFFQWNPYGREPGNTRWGMTTSRDLFHWSEPEQAVCPDDRDGLIFSGSAVIDFRNVSGLQKGTEPPVLLFYTGTGFRYFPRVRPDENGLPPMPPDFQLPETVQCMAYSVDGGKTFRKYEKNPIIRQVAPMNRDPKVIWCDETNDYILVLYLTQNDFALFHSDNLLDWKQEQTLTLPGSAECPDIYPMYLDQDPGQKKWVIHVSPENYVIGHFEGKQFVAETEPIFGPTHENTAKMNTFMRYAVYAPQVFFGTAPERVIQMGWLRTAFPGATFLSSMTIPWDLDLVTTPKGMRLRKNPVPEIAALYKKSWCAKGSDCLTLNEALYRHAPVAADYKIEAELAPNGSFLLVFDGVTVLYRHDTHKLYFPTGVYTLPVEGDRLDLRVIVDKGSLELFACGGLFYTGWNGYLARAASGCEVLEVNGAALTIQVNELGD